jgi:hypothetical protein
MAGVEFAMRGRARFGLLVLGLAASPLAFAHAPGVSHTYEGGQPVITVRLVPAEAEAAKSKRINALDPAPGQDHANPTDETSGIETDALPAETAQPMSADGFDVPATPDVAAEAPAADESAAVTRYPNARPVIKPNTETGVGGALDLTEPEPTEDAKPRPMRLNSVDRPRRVVERARREPPAPPRAPRVRTPAPTAPDPLDEALPSRIVDAPVNMMQLPPVKTEERIAGGN